MPVVNPGRRLFSSVKLAFVAKRLERGRRSTTATLSLTSMIDVLVVTLVFLLTTFSAGGCPQGRAQALPRLTGGLDMIDAPIVAVTGREILVDGAAAGNTGGIEESGRVERLDEVFRMLAAKRDLWKQLHPRQDFPGVVLLMLDRHVQAVVLKSIVQTAAYAGFPNTSFVVERR
jgi:hypothetical protein